MQYNSPEDKNKVQDIITKIFWRNKVSQAYKTFRMKWTQLQLGFFLVRWHIKSPFLNTSNTIVITEK